MTGVAETSLFERVDELGQLDAALDALEHAGSLVVVEGPGGIGKSSLLATLLTRARARGFRTGSARCSELERQFAFGAVRQLLGPLAPLAAFGGAAAHARPLFDGSDDHLDVAPDALFSRLHGLFWLCAELTAEGPLVLVVDDAQWADPGSLAFIAFLRTRLADVPLMLAVATRPVAAPDPALAEVLADPAALALRPRPLSDDAVRRWAELLLGSPPDDTFTATCHATTGGNPLWLRELLREASAEGLPPNARGAARLGDLTPRGVASVVLLRLARLAPPARELARAVALLGDGAGPDEAAALAEVSAADAHAAIDSLVRADLLRDTDRLAYTHPIVRSAVLDDLPTVIRAERHRQAAALLAARGEGPERVASQLLAAGGAAGPADLAPLLAAARNAIALGDPSAAAAFLRAALPATEGEERAELLIELAGAEGRTGERAAVASLETALSISADPERRVRAAVHLARILNFTGQAPRSVDVLEDVERGLPPGSAAFDLIAAELLGAAHITRSAARRLAPRMALLTEPEGPVRTALDRLTLASLAFAESIYPGGDAGEAARLARRALGGEVPVEPVLGGQIVVMANLVLMLAGHHSESESNFAQALETARANGSATAVAAFCAMRSMALLRLGRLSAAEADAREALDIGTQVPPTQTLGHAALGVALTTTLERGGTDEELDEVLAQQPIDLDILPASMPVISRGDIALARGRPREAVDHYLACDLPDPGWARDGPTLVPWRSGAAIALLARGDPGDAAEAARLADEELALARAFGAPAPIGHALRVSALTVDDGSRRERLEEAVRVLDDAEAPLDLARARAELGAELRRGNERSAARELLEPALVEAQRCGAARLASRVEDELASLGVRPTGAVALSRGLTPSERRVASLAAEGLMNREIAQRLFVTEKTVESHLRSTFRKLGLRSRRELADALAAWPERADEGPA
jgi:DNA-binding CsgD family transcriptional regulator